MSSHDNEPKMVQFLDQLTAREQAIICFHVRKHSGELRYDHLHPSLLPFVPMEVVRKCLMCAKAVRPVAVILSKLPDSDGIDSISLILTDKKVYRMFGPHPERGKPITWLPRKTDKFGNAVNPVVSLQKKHSETGFGVWQVNVAREYRTAVYRWLADICC